MVEKRFSRLQLRKLIENRIGTKVEPSSLEELENSFGGFDGFTSAFKTGRFEQKITRRDFAKLSGSMLAILTGVPAILQSCATTGLIKEEGPVHYPKLPGQKIQSPEHYGLEGCMTGVYTTFGGLEGSIEHYHNIVGDYPTFFMMKGKYSLLPPGIQEWYPSMMEICSKKNIIPFITFELRKVDKSNHPENQRVISDITKGVYDQIIKISANRLKSYGKKNGGFFIKTMREMNLPWWPWGGKSNKFKNAWKHIWNIFFFHVPKAITI